MLNLTSPRALERARARAQAIDRMRHLADRAAELSAARTRHPEGQPDAQRHEPSLWVLHAR